MCERELSELSVLPHREGVHLLLLFPSSRLSPLAHPPIPPLLLLLPSSRHPVMTAELVIRYELRIGGDTVRNAVLKLNRTSLVAQLQQAVFDDNRARQP